MKSKSKNSFLNSERLNTNNNIVALANVPIRNSGLDLLRILAMFLVLTHHIVFFGGLLGNAVPFSPAENILLFLNIACIVCNNLYALLTGYLYVNSKYKFSKIIELWLEVFFYSIIPTLIFYFFTPIKIDLKDLIKSFFPVSASIHWYFTEYFCLFFFIPFINILIKNITKQQFQKLIFIILLLFPGIAWFARIFGEDVFNINNSYSFIWLMALYFIGAYLSLYKDDFSKYGKNRHLLLYFISILVTFVVSCVTSFVKYKITNNINSRALTASMINPLIVFGSIQLFLFFSKLKVKKFNKILSKISVASFAVYLIHTQFAIFDLLIRNKFTNMLSGPWYLLPFKILFVAFIIFSICIIIDLIREFLFKKFKVNILCEKIVNFSKKYITKLLTKFKIIYT